MVFNIIGILGQLNRSVDGKLLTPYNNSVKHPLMNKVYIIPPGGYY
jgi:hypothetical protein